MASNGKKKTTMAKLNRERALRERRLEKQVKKALRKRAAAGGPEDPSPTSEAEAVEATIPPASISPRPAHRPA